MANIQTDGHLPSLYIDLRGTYSTGTYQFFESGYKFNDLYSIVLIIDDFQISLILQLIASCQSLPIQMNLCWVSISVVQTSAENSGIRGAESGVRNEAILYSRTYRIIEVDVHNFER